MIFLDENITLNQRRLLEGWHYSIQQIGVEIEHKGTQDEQIITWLQQTNGVTFITGDSDFFERKYCHSNYCVIFLDVEQHEMAFFLRKLFRLPSFDTQAKRSGKIIKTTQRNISYWQLWVSGLQIEEYVL